MKWLILGMSVGLLSMAFQHEGEEMRQMALAAMNLSCLFIILSAIDRKIKP